MTVQVEGMGTIAGPPARGRISAGRALAIVTIAAVETRLVVVANNILVFSERVLVAAMIKSSDCRHWKCCNVCRAKCLLGCFWAQ